MTGYVSILFLIICEQKCGLHVHYLEYLIVFMVKILACNSFLFQIKKIN